MKLSELIDCKENLEITSLSFDSKSCKSGSVYFCLDGVNHDGRDFCEEAIKNGAVAIVASKPVSDSKVPVIIVDDARHELALASCAFYGHPSKRVTLIGITGTNGKTTTSYIVRSILMQSGRKVGLIGTNGIFYNDITIPPMLTTPDPIDLNRTLKDMADAGIDCVVMEVSAHAIKLNKLDGLFFEVAAFTNLSEDHLDFFKSMEEYGRAKAKFFQPYFASKCVINIDDAFGRSLNKACCLKTLTYGCDNPADVFAIDLKMSMGGLRYIININDEIEEIKFCISGRFNAYNTLCAAAICSLLGISANDIKRGIRNLKNVSGRFNIINTTKYGIVIDFAHTEDGLYNIINAINEFKQGRLITVFGCGGNRDRDKRALMGKVATTLSDFVVITSDNPRYEKPEEIIEEIENGAVNENYAKITDRKEAIRFALDIAQENDVILIAGKGAEEYQEIKGVRYEYNDEIFVKSLIEEKGI